MALRRHRRCWSCCLPWGRRSLLVMTHELGHSRALKAVLPAGTKGEGLTNPDKLARCLAHRRSSEHRGSPCESLTPGWHQGEAESEQTRSRRSPSGGKRQVHQKHNPGKSHRGRGTKGSGDLEKEVTPAGTQRASQRRWPWVRAPYPSVTHSTGRQRLVSCRLRDAA